MNNYEINKMKIKDIQRACLKGEMEPFEAMKSIDTVIGGITSVDFKEGLKFKVVNHDGIYPLQYQGKNRHMKLIHSLAAAAYLIAGQINGNYKPGGVHIDETTSTKHHLAGIQQIYTTMKGGKSN